jgi:hypothetical protein
VRKAEYQPEHRQSAWNRIYGEQNSLERLVGRNGNTRDRNKYPNVEVEAAYDPNQMMHQWWPFNIYYGENPNHLHHFDRHLDIDHHVFVSAQSPIVAVTYRVIQTDGNKDYEKKEYNSSECHGTFTLDARIPFLDVTIRARHTNHTRSACTDFALAIFFVFVVRACRRWTSRASFLFSALVNLQRGGAVRPVSLL